MENFLSSPFEMCQLSWNRDFLSRVERFSQTNISEWGGPVDFFPLSVSLSLSPSLEPLISIEAVRPRHLEYRFSDETWIPYLLDRNPCADRFEVHVLRVKGPDRERRETDGRERFDGRATCCPTRSILKLKFEKLSWEIERLTPSILSNLLCKKISNHHVCHRDEELSWKLNQSRENLNADTFDILLWRKIRSRNPRLSPGWGISWKLNQSRWHLDRPSILSVELITCKKIRFRTTFVKMKKIGVMQWIPSYARRNFIIIKETIFIRYTYCAKCEFQARCSKL